MDKKHKQFLQRKKFFLLIKKENQIDTFKLEGVLDNFNRYTFKNVFDSKALNDNIVFSCQKVQHIFLPCKVNLTTDLLKKFYNLEPVICQ